MASSVHRLLMSVNAVHKDFAVGRFKVPAAGTNAARIRPEGEIGSLESTLLASS